MPKKYFTIEDAQKLLPKIKKSLLRLQNLKKTIDAILSVRIDSREIGYEEFIETSYGNKVSVELKNKEFLSNTKLNKEYHKISYEFYKELENLEKTGCVLKDLEQGLVDFYCKFEKRDIFLCWKLGEDKVKAWHEIDSGFASRNPIIDLEQ